MKEFGLKLFISLLLTTWLNSVSFSQPIIRVYGDNTETIKKQVEFYLNYLDVNENIFIDISIYPVMPDHLKGITIPIKSSEPGISKIFRILIDDKLSAKKQMIVLAHEMIHVKQFTKNELIQINKKKVTWKGKKYYNSYAHNKPWEKEAFGADNKLAMLYQNLVNNKENGIAKQTNGRISKSSQFLNKEECHKYLPDHVHDFPNPA